MTVTLFTPCVSEVMGIIVLTSCVCPGVCVCVTTLRAQRTDYRLGFWHEGPVVEYLGHVISLRSYCRSKVKVTWSKNVDWDIPFTSGSLVWTCQSEA